MPKYCILFQRVSTDRQETTRQNQNLFHQAESEGYKPEDIYVIDYHESGVNLSYEQRQGFAKLEEIIDKEPIKIVYCHEISRVARRTDVTFTLIQKLTDRGINLHIQNPQIIRTLKEDGKEDPMAKLILMFLAYFAEEEAKLFKQRSKSGVDALKAQGKTARGRFMLGYRRNAEKYVEVDPEQAGNVKRIFEDYANTQLSVVDIYRKYRDIGVFNLKARTDDSASHTVYRILTNKRYYGEENYPAIIEKELFDKVQVKLLDKNIAHSNRRTKELYICRGIIKTEDGYTLTPYRTRKSYTYTNPDNKKQVNISIPIADRIIWQEAIAIYAAYTTAKSCEDKDMTIERINQLKKDKAELENTAKNKDGEFKRALELYTKGFLSMVEVEEKKNETDNAKEEITQKINSLSVEIATLKTILSNESDYRDILKNSANANGQTMYDIIHAMIDKAVVKRRDKKEAELIIYPKVSAKLTSRTYNIESNLDPSTYKIYTRGCKTVITQLLDGHEMSIIDGSWIK